MIYICIISLYLNIHKLIIQFILQDGEIICENSSAAMEIVLGQNKIASYRQELNADVNLYVCDKNKTVIYCKEGSTAEEFVKNDLCINILNALYYMFGAM